MLKRARVSAAAGIPNLFVATTCPGEKAIGLAVGCLHRPHGDQELADAVAAAYALSRGETDVALPKRMHRVGVPPG